MTFGERIAFTLKAWPAVTAATIGLCYLTKTVAGWLGFDLPDQQSVELLRTYMIHAFDSPKLFLTAALLVAQVVVLMPVVEELVFRWLLCRLPQRLLSRRIKARDARQETGGTGEAGATAAPNTAIRQFDYSTIRLFDYSIIRLFDYSIILLSSVLFASAHYVQQPWPDAAFLALFFFGAAQCWLYRRTGRLWCAMLSHALFNLTNLVLLLLLPEAA